MRKKLFVFLFIFYVSFGVSFSSSFDLFVRGAEGGLSGSEKLTLYVDGKTYKNPRIEFLERTVFEENVYPQNYILDLRIFNFYKAISDGISNFIDRIYPNFGILVVITRKKVYTFTPIIPKDKLKDRIINMAKEDTLSYEAELKASLNNLHRIIRGFLQPSSGMKNDSNTRTACMNFISDFLNEWSNYKSRFLLFDRGQILTVLNYLDKYPFNNWYVGFYHREIIPYYDEIQKAIDSLQNFVSSAVSGEDQAVAPMISAGINKITKALMVADDNVLKKYRYEFLIRNLNFSVLLLNNKMKTSSNEGFLDVSPDFENFLLKLSSATGGRRVITDNLLEGLDEIGNNIDRFFILSLKLKEKNYKIKIVAEGKKLNYVHDLRKDVIEKFKKIKKDEIEVKSAKFINGVIAFKIKKFSYRKVKGNKLGILDIRIFLLSPKGEILYRTRNFLQVKKPPSLKVPLRKAFKEGKIYIYVNDIFGKKASVFSLEI